MADSETGMPGAVVKYSREIHVENGERRLGVDVILTPEQFDMLRLGYVCPPPPYGCLARQREAFPEKCIEPYCNYNLRRDLPRFLEQAFKGEEDPWETTKGNLEAQGVWLPD